jgi:hypothetical protein
MHNDDGTPTGFAISRYLITRRGVTRVVRSLSGSRVIREQPRFWFCGRDDFAAFLVDDVSFLAIEPFGDNSEFWIVSESATGDTPQLRKLRMAFANHRALFGLLAP